MKTENPPSVGVDSCCAPPASGNRAPVTEPESVAGSPGGQLFRIATMDCSAEESDIRRALEPIPNIRSLGFQLGARTLRIDAAEETYPLALAAIREAGFDRSEERRVGKECA